MSILKNRARERFLIKIINKAEQLLKNNDVNKKPYTVTKYVILHYYVKALKLAKGIVAVCKKSLDSDAKILFRSLFEIDCYCEYILIDPDNIKRAENCIAISYIEDKRTEDYIKKFGAVTIDNIPISLEEKEALKGRVRKTAQIRSINYDFILNKLKERNHRYKKMSDKKIIATEKLTLGKVIEEINEVFNKETKENNTFWRYYIFGFRYCSEAVHNTDFESNVKVDKGKLKYYLDSRKSTIQMILGATSTYLFRMMDIANSIFDFQKDAERNSLLKELKILQDK